MRWRVPVDHQPAREPTPQRHVRRHARRRIRASDPQRPERPAVPAIIPRDVAASHPVCASSTWQQPPGGRNGSGQGGGAVTAHAPGGNLRRLRSAPSAGSHRPPTSRGPAAAAAGTQPGRLRGLNRPDPTRIDSRTGSRTRSSRGAAPDASSTRRAAQSGHRSGGFRYVQSRGPHPRHRVPRGTGARKQRHAMAGGCPAHRLTV